MDISHLSKKELIKLVKDLTIVAGDNKEIADRAVQQAKEWQTLYLTCKNCMRNTNFH